MLKNVNAASCMVNAPTQRCSQSVDEWMKISRLYLVCNHPPFVNDSSSTSVWQERTLFNILLLSRCKHRKTTVKIALIDARKTLVLMKFISLALKSSNHARDVQGMPLGTRTWEALGKLNDLHQIQRRKYTFICIPWCKRPTHAAAGKWVHFLIFVAQTRPRHSAKKASHRPDCPCEACAF
jgi:hypothetical protein